MGSTEGVVIVVLDIHFQGVCRSNQRERMQSYRLLMFVFFGACNVGMKMKS